MCKTASARFARPAFSEETKLVTMIERKEKTDRVKKNQRNIFGSSSLDMITLLIIPKAANENESDNPKQVKMKNTSLY